MIAAIREWWHMRQARLAEEHLRRAESLYARAEECMARGDVRGAARMFLEYTEAIEQAERLVGGGAQ